MREEIIEKKHAVHFDESFFCSLVSPPRAEIEKEKKKKDERDEKEELLDVDEALRKEEEKKKEFEEEDNRKKKSPEKAIDKSSSLKVEKVSPEGVKST